MAERRRASGITRPSLVPEEVILVFFDETRQSPLNAPKPVMTPVSVHGDQIGATADRLTQGCRFDSLVWGTKPSPEDALSPKRGIARWVHGPWSVISGMADDRSRGGQVGASEAIIVID